MAEDHGNLYREPMPDIFGNNASRSTISQASVRLPGAAPAPTSSAAPIRPPNFGVGASSIPRLHPTPIRTTAPMTMSQFLHAINAASTTTLVPPPLRCQAHSSVPIGGPPNQPCSSLRCRRIARYCSDYNLTYPVAPTAGEPSGPCHLFGRAITGRSISGGIQLENRKQSSAIDDNIVNRISNLLANFRNTYRNAFEGAEERPLPTSATPQPPPPPPRSTSIPREPWQPEMPIGFTITADGTDCPFQFCRYVINHIHCANCAFGSADVNTFNDHVTKHARWNKLMGDDFTMYASGESVWPNLPDGVYGNTKFSYFCKKCDFVCNQSSLIVPHRQQHLSVNQFAGKSFRKVRYYELCSQDCMGVSICKFNLKRTHFHCTDCHAALQAKDLDSHKLQCYKVTSTNNND